MHGYAIKKKTVCALIVLFLFSAKFLFAGEMARPRTVNVLSTQYFDFLFPNENSQTAMLLASQADELYLKAKQNFGCTADFRTIVVISPDSDTLYVKYTASPYNRIVVFDAIGSIETASYANGIVDLFYHEVGRAVSQSVRSPAMNFVAQHFLGDSFQPVGLFNVPYSFLEGAVYALDEKSLSGLLYDNWNLQLLMQAKTENKFPSLLQVSGAYDIYPGTNLDFIAAAAFYAYIQQKWGIEKFGEYWQECGKLNFLRLDSGIFEAVYGMALSDTWLEFIDAIPLPQEIVQDEQNVKTFLKTDYDSNYKYIVSTNYGLVWYDELKEEVDISGFYDYESQRQLLFLANGITNLTVSPCGRFLAVSHVQGGIRQKFEHDVVRIYDLKQRKFLSEKNDMRDGAIVTLNNGHYGVIGNYVDDGYSCLVVYECEEMNSLLGYKDSQSQVIYSRSFEAAVTPYTPVALGPNHFACLICRNNEWSIFVSDIIPDGERYGGLFSDKDNDEDVYRISNEAVSVVPEVLKIRNLRYADYVEVSGKRSDRGSSYCLLFDFVLQNQPSLVRTGWLFFDANSIPSRSLITSTDYYGGMSSGVMFNCNLYYSSQRYNYSQIRYINLNDIALEEAVISYSADIPQYYIQPDYGSQEQNVTIEFEKYSPWKYMRKGSWKAFMPVRDITLQDGVKTGPGLGVTFETQSDPFTNNELLISAAKGFVPLDFIKNYNASVKTQKEQKARKIELSKDAVFGVYFKNTSTPADATVAGVFSFNEDGEYTFKAFSDIMFSLPLAMTFRRLYFDVSVSFISSTTYWDITQTELFPNLTGWPSFSKSYRMWQSSTALQYSNIHKYGMSPMKKLGIETGIKATASWEWGKLNPFQIYTGMFATGEIPFLMPVQNYNNMILCLPTSVHAELFYTNGKAVDAYAQILFFGMEIQNGFWRLYFPRVALYGGYDIALEYDTATVKLPDLRHLERFYETFGNCYLNDSFYCVLDFGLTPVIGKFSKYKLESSLRFEKYLRSKEFKLKFDIQISGD